jgi:glycosyltransferase involved in cell wall biosynthesis
VPNADVYHSAVAGYGGVLGALAKYTTRKPFILTEHGIYPREREEELMQADWVIPSMRNAWINSFYNLSKLAYAYADRVTSLFESACYKQQEIGCDPSKCRIIPNGIDCSRFINIPIRDTSETINIGAFVRFAPIKDLKTLIYAFYNLHSRINTTKLFIMGGTDDPTYRDECLTLIKNLELDSVEVTGYIDTIEYMESMDFTVMSSISEGQPLAILESLASGRPCVTTNVGNCSELLCSEDGYGQAGIYCTPMDTVGLANAMELMCLNSNIRKMFGNNGKERIKNRYTHTQMIDSYLRVYDEVV